MHCPHQQATGHSKKQKTKAHLHRHNFLSFEQNHHDSQVLHSGFQSGQSFSWHTQAPENISNAMTAARLRSGYLVYSQVVARRVPGKHRNGTGHEISYASGNRHPAAPAVSPARHKRAAVMCELMCDAYTFNPVRRDWTRLPPLNLGMFETPTKHRHCQVMTEQAGDGLA